MVTDTSGKTVPVTTVKPVPRDTEEGGPVPDFRGRGLRDERLKTTLRPFAMALADGLGNREVALTAASRMLGEDFRLAKPSSMTSKSFVALFGGLLVLSGEGPATTVRKIRRRIRGKRGGV